MGRNEIHASPWAASLAIENIAGSTESRAQGCCRRFPPPEIPSRIAELVVPLMPTRRKGAKLISSPAAMPGLSDEFNLSENRILAAGLQESTLVVEPVWFARKDCAQVKTKPVHVRLFYPITQTVRHHLDHAWVAEI